MTRPEIIRADSIDLQAHDNPSAQDHSRQPTRPSPLGTGPPAPHQAEALRDLHDEIAEQQNLSPRVSQDWSHEKHDFDEDGESDMEDHEHDQLSQGQNGGMNGGNAEDGDLADAEGDEDDDDDMMDKISSSPSIDDGGYSLPIMWPSRHDSLSPAGTPNSPTISPSFSPSEGDRSSSSFMETPVHFPLGYMAYVSDGTYPRIKINHHHHYSGEYSIGPTGNTPTINEQNEENRRRAQLSTQHSQTALVDTYDQDFDITDHDMDDAIDTLEEHGDIQQSHDFSPDDLERTLRADDCEQGTKARSTQLGNIPDLTPQSFRRSVDVSPGGAITIPYESSEDDEQDDDDYDTADEYLLDNPRFVDSGWGGECLQELEDIDFEFVYALHTFVATVEGQANATKGDTMVLLDDSNSYWWLVRVVKDSSIGYLPAEHIETPTERLARLNKHRNIDLSATMLQDQAEKTINPLKKAMRRRNAKTVQFTAPTYFEASENEYSSEEEEEENGGQYYNQEAQGAETDAIEDEPITVEPLRTKAEVREVTSEDTTGEGKGSSEISRNSDELFEGKGRSRNGTVRNTDSFFKDDSVETRKITLTPNLLRDDSLTSTVRTSDDFNKDTLQKRPSLDKLEKDGSFEKTRDGDKKKKDKKEKEKKPGMLSGLFKRKDKKSKGDFKDEDIEEIIMGKRSSNESTQRESQDSSQKVSDEFDAPKEVEETKPQQAAAPEKVEKTPNKLQKQNNASPPKPVEAQPVSSMRVVQPETQPERSEPAAAPAPAPAPVVEPVEMEAPHEPVKVTSPVKITSPVEEPTATPLTAAPQRPVPGAFPDSYVSTPATEREVIMEQERLSESPVHIESENASNELPALVIDTSSQEEASSPTPSPSPELVDVNEARQSKGSDGGASTSTLTPAWNDAHLRTFFEDDGEIRDLMVVVYDNSGVVPAGPDHPLTGKLFKEENAKLADITSRLDGMLGDWLARKSRPQVASR